MSINLWTADESFGFASLPPRAHIYLFLVVIVQYHKTTNAKNSFMCIHHCSWYTTSNTIPCSAVSWRIFSCCRPTRRCREEDTLSWLVVSQSAMKAIELSFYALLWHKALKVLTMEPIIKHLLMVLLPLLQESCIVHVYQMRFFVDLMYCDS